jgi:hypothetical protein
MWNSVLIIFSAVDSSMSLQIYFPWEMNWKVLREVKVMMGI